MVRWIGVAACLFFLILAAPSFADTPVTLRPRVEANGPAITLGDVFDGAGAVAGRAVAPAPPPGQVATLNAAFLAAAAQSAGLSWTAPAGVTQVRVVRPAGARATLPASSPMSQAEAESGVRRGDTVMLSFVAPGIQLNARARALENAAIGESVRLVNLSSNRTIDAVVTGPGAASASQ